MLRMEGAQESVRVPFQEVRQVAANGHETTPQTVGRVRALKKGEQTFNEFKQRRLRHRLSQGKLSSPHAASTPLPTPQSAGHSHDVSPGSARSSQSMFNTSELPVSKRSAQSPLRLTPSGNERSPALTTPPTFGASWRRGPPAETPKVVQKMCAELLASAIDEVTKLVEARSVPKEESPCGEGTEGEGQATVMACPLYDPTEVSHPAGGSPTSPDQASSSGSPNQGSCSSAEAMRRMTYTRCALFSEEDGGNDGALEAAKEGSGEDNAAAGKLPLPSPSSFQDDAAGVTGQAAAQSSISLPDSTKDSDCGRKPSFPVPSLPAGCNQAHQLKPRRRQDLANAENIRPARQGQAKGATKGGESLLATPLPAQTSAPGGAPTATSMPEPASLTNPRVAPDKGSGPGEAAQSGRGRQALQPLGHSSSTSPGVSDSAPSEMVVKATLPTPGLGNLPLRRCTSIPRLTPLPEELASVEVDIRDGKGENGCAAAKTLACPSAAWVAMDCNPTPAMELLFENQAMRTEREELKQELRMISLRLAAIEERTKAWPQGPPRAKGRSRSVPRPGGPHKPYPLPNLSRLQIQAPDDSSPGSPGSSMAQSPAPWHPQDGTSTARRGRSSSRNRPNATARRPASVDSRGSGPIPAAPLPSHLTLQTRLGGARRAGGATREPRGVEARRGLPSAAVLGQAASQAEAGEAPGSESGGTTGLRGVAKGATRGGASSSAGRSSLRPPLAAGPLARAQMLLEQIGNIGGSRTQLERGLPLRQSKQAQSNGGAMGSQGRPEKPAGRRGDSSSPRRRAQQHNENIDPSRQSAAAADTAAPSGMSVTLKAPGSATTTGGAVKAAVGKPTPVALPNPPVNVPQRPPGLQKGGPYLPPPLAGPRKPLAAPKERLQRAMGAGSGVQGRAMGGMGGQVPAALAGSSVSDTEGHSCDAPEGFGGEKRAVVQWWLAGAPSPRDAKAFPASPNS